MLEVLVLFLFFFFNITLFDCLLLVLLLKNINKIRKMDIHKFIYLRIIKNNIILKMN